jgi:hypothetical protein
MNSMSRNIRAATSSYSLTPQMHSITFTYAPPSITHTHTLHSLTLQNTITSHTNAHPTQTPEGPHPPPPRHQYWDRDRGSCITESRTKWKQVRTCGLYVIVCSVFVVGNVYQCVICFLALFDFVHYLIFDINVCYSYSALLIFLL